MSIVTNLILTTSPGDGGSEDEHPNVDKLNAWLCKAHGPAETLKQVDQCGGGNRALECDVFVGAVSYLDWAELIAAFKGIPWESSDCVQLMLKGQEDDRFTIYQLNYEGMVLVLDPKEAQPMRSDDL